MSSTRSGNSMPDTPGNKLLFLAYPFPPANITAAVRTWNMARYLGRLGWEVTVVTLHPSIWRQVEQPERMGERLQKEGIRLILTDHRWRCLSPDHLRCWNRGPGWLAGGICRRITRHLGIDRGIGWVKPVEQACAALTPEDVDVLLATGSPFAAFTVARRLSERLACPYILDYRDPWTGNPHVTRSSSPHIFRKEARLLAESAAVTIVSASWGEAMDRRFGLGSKLHVISNGYDPEDLAAVVPKEFDHFAIVYTGNFYPPKRVISPLMAVLDRLKIHPSVQDIPWFFHYYGGQEAHVRAEAERFGVMDRVVCHGRVPRAEALSAVRGAHVAVVITSVAAEATMEERGIVTGKVFEALGLGTPVLLIAPRESDARVVIDTAGSGGCFTGTDLQGMESFLLRMMTGWRPQPADRERFAWPGLASRLDQILRHAIAGNEMAGIS
ncbi:MAG: glycosyltransferase [Nitrospinota bacterium]|nr:MAG: glycosyltransferase [Nitrospinota bacterium]